MGRIASAGADLTRIGQAGTSLLPLPRVWDIAEDPPATPL
jgi:hypothetical protein